MSSVSRIIQLKKQFKDGIYTNYTEWLKAKSLNDNIPVESIKWIFEENIDSSEMKRFVSHIKTHGYEKVARDKFLSCPRGSSKEIYAHYGTDFKLRGTSLESFIYRYGEEEGLSRFNDFKNKSRSRVNDGKYSDEEWNKLNREGSPRCVEYYISRGLCKDLQEAKKLVSNYQKENSGVHKEYYTKRNISDDILKNINKKKTEKFRLLNYQYLCKDLGMPIKIASGIFSILKNSENKFSKSDLISRGISESFVEKLFSSDDKILFLLKEYMDWQDDLIKISEFKSDYWIYRNIVESVSCNLDHSLIEGYGLKDENGLPYEMDHMYSIRDGFSNSVDPFIVGSKVNIRYISRSENRVKNSKSAISLEELLKAYDENS